MMSDLWWGALAAVTGVVPTSVYLAARPRFTRWREDVWALRVAYYRRELQDAIGTADRPAARVAEDALNKALINYGKWKRRAQSHTP